MVMIQDTNDSVICGYLAVRLGHNVEDIEQAHSAASRNVCTVLRRQILNTVNRTSNHPLCTLSGEKRLVEVLGTLPLDLALLTLARIYDVAHVALCKANAALRKGKPHNEAFRRKPSINLRELARQLRRDREVVEGEILLEADLHTANPLRAVWKPLAPMSFNNLEVLNSLSDLLPGELSESHEYVGIGGGGGSDIISASLLGHLLRPHKKEMRLLVSTRTWETGSQGRSDSKLGIKREVYDHGGLVEAHGRPVPGTFRVIEGTYAEGRDLEAIPIPFHPRDCQIFMVLDQSVSTSEIPDAEKVNLRDQFDAVLTQAKRPIDTILIVDTGGDVFGADSSGSTTPDQDLRVQQVMIELSSNHNLVTAVVTPGVDAPEDAPQKAFDAGGRVYKPTDEEKTKLLDLLAKKYKMDGSDPSRFGKTTLALQARLRGIVGWTSLDLPEYVVDTWENPWNSFVYIRDCMSDIILMPTRKLLPLIEPQKQLKFKHWVMHCC